MYKRVVGDVYFQYIAVSTYVPFNAEKLWEVLLKTAQNYKYLTAKFTADTEVRN